jgi:hypothetical protein
MISWYLQKYENSLSNSSLITTTFQIRSIRRMWHSPLVYLIQEIESKQIGYAKSDRLDCVRIGCGGTICQGDLNLGVWISQIG